MMKKICLIMLSVVGAQSAVAGDAITTGGGVANSLNVSTTSHTYIGNTSATTDIYGSQIYAAAESGSYGSALGVRSSDTYLYTTSDRTSVVRPQSALGTGYDATSGLVYSSLTSGLYDTANREWVTQNIVNADAQGVDLTADSTTVGTRITMFRGSNSLTIDSTGTTVGGSASLNGATNNIGTSVASVNTIGTSGSTNNLVGTTNIGTAGGNTSIGSAGSTNVILGSTSLTGTTTINSSGSSNTTIGHNGSGSGTVSLVSGPNSISVSSSENLIAGTNTIQGTTNINTTGSSATSIGNSSSTLTLVGSTVNVGANANATVNLGTGSGSTVSIGSASGNSTVSFNGNRVQGVGNAVAGTDAVNLNQMNAMQSGLQNQINSVSSNAYSGTATVAAIAGIPALADTKFFNVGVGYGNYINQSAAAVGGHVRLSENTVFKAAFGFGNSNTTSSVGLGVSF